MREIRLLRSRWQGWKRSHGQVYTGTNGETRATDKTTTSRITAPALDPTAVAPMILGSIPGFSGSSKNVEVFGDLAFVADH